MQFALGVGDETTERIHEIFKTVRYSLSVSYVERQKQSGKSGEEGKGARRFVEEHGHEDLLTSHANINRGRIVVGRVGSTIKLPSARWLNLIVAFDLLGLRIKFISWFLSSSVELEIVAIR